MSRSGRAEGGRVQQVVTGTSAVTPSADLIDPKGPELSEPDLPNAEAPAEDDRPSTTGTFAHKVLGALGAKPIIAAMALMGTMLPGLPGCDVAPPEPDPIVEIVAPAEVTDPQLSSTVLRFRTQLLQRGLLPDAQDVRVWMLQPPGRQKNERILAFGSQLAHGAQLHAVTTPLSYSSKHADLQQSVDAALAAIGEGAKPAEELFAQMAAVKVFEQAAFIKHVRSEKKGAATEIISIPYAESTLTLAQAIARRIDRAPPDSPARTFLSNLAPERTGQIDELARQIRESINSIRGGLVFGAAESALSSQLDNARDEGLLVIKSIGSPDRPLGKRRTEPLFHEYEPVITVGATVIGENGPAIAENQGTGFVTLAAPHGDPDVATVYTSSVAAVAVRNNPDLTPVQLEQILMNPAAIRDLRDTTKDGIGVLLGAEAVTLADKAAHGAVHFETDPRRRLADKAIKGGVRPGADDPYLKHVSHIRSELTARGLPIRGDGVKVFVAELSWSDHAGAVIRTIADPEIGLAPGAEVSLLLDAPWYDSAHHEASNRYKSAKKTVLDGAVPTKQLILDRALLAIYVRAADVRLARSMTDGSQTSFLNMSYGSSVADFASELKSRLEESPEGSAARAFLDEKGKKGLLQWIDEIIHSEEGQAHLAQAIQDFNKELALARDARLAVFSSAGNEGDEVILGYDRSIRIPAPGPSENLVGATVMHDPLDLNDDTSTDFSSEGLVTTSGPGSKLPVGYFKNISGTSFSTPYNLATGILMVKANPNLHPDQIWNMLQSHQVAHDIPGKRDGAGVIDPIAAVTLAATPTP